MNDLVRLPSEEGFGTGEMDPTNQQPDDATLAEQAKRGDIAAFGVLYERYAQMVRAIVASRTDDRERLDDLVQETFLRTFQCLKELRKPESFRSWVFGIAQNVARERRRSMARERHEYFTGEAMDEHLAEPRLDSLSEEVAAVFHELDRLPERESMALRLFFLEECDVLETAVALGVSRSSVYVILKRACSTIAANLANLRDRGTSR